MYHLEQRERFWDSKVEELKNKLNSKPWLDKLNNAAKVSQGPKDNQSNSVGKKEIQPGDLVKKTSEAKEIAELEGIYQEKLRILEKENKNNRELYESRVKALQFELLEKEQQILEVQEGNKVFQERVRAVQAQKAPGHQECEAKICEQQKKIQVLEEENQILKEQIEIYQEFQNKKSNEKEKLQQLSFMILSKDKNIEQETINQVRKTLGDTQANVIERFYEKNKDLEQESKNLERKLAQEYAGKVENLEKIRVLQETLAKIAPDCGYDSDLSKIKAQIIAAKAQASGNPSEKLPTSMELYEKTVELDILKSEIQALSGENSRLREDCKKHSSMNEELETRLRFLDAPINDRDILCFIQCEAAALEDMLADPGSQDLNSEELY